MLPVSTAHALQYGGGVNDTHWSITGSVFECNFEQKIPNYGRARFYHRAGEDVRFQLLADRNLMETSRARLTLLPPPWQPSQRSESLGTAKVTKALPNVSLDSRRSNQFLHGLLEGRWPSVTHRSYYDRNRSIQVRVSAVAFEASYRVYLACVNQLLPINFGQVARSKVLFKAGQEKIDFDAIDVLDRIIFYIENDPRVVAVYLDGHSDNSGRRYDNRQVSKRRVEDVEQYLIQRGINPEMITARFHGDRYPIASNKTGKGRAQNRRVTVRLEMQDGAAIPPELQFVPPARKNVVGAL